MRARHALITAVAALVALGCGAGGGDSAQPEPPAASETAAAGRTGAQTVVDAIGQKWPLPNPRDTSSGCQARPGDTAPGCTSRVTTDAVTVTEYPDEQTAQHAADVNGERARRAGRYVLTWNGEQDLTSDEARDSMVTITEGLAG